MLVPAYEERRLGRLDLGNAFGRSSSRIDADFFLVARIWLELDHAIDHRVDRVVAAQTNVDSRPNLCATLANNNRAGLDGFAAILLDTAHLGFAVTTIARATNTFFMSHRAILSQ